MKKATKSSIRSRMNAYPEALKVMPFCCWKYAKDAKGRKTKVPYNAKTGYRGDPSDISTFTDLETVLKAYEIGTYDGIGIKVSGKVGGIDLDHCISAEGTVTENAQKVLDILPDAFTEFSPSGTGMHLYFFVPEGFEFDKTQYYINNHRVRMEIYLPDATEHFLTVTGNPYRENSSGSMNITTEQLAEFLDSFMKRPMPQLPAAAPPEGGSVLSDGDVIRKASEGKDGDRFLTLYRGDWEGEGWSHSEADLSVCNRLAFYCRGDEEQIDRLFRESGLMRDKWDRSVGACTYGEATIKRAIAGCTSFYDPEHGRVSAEEEFADLDDYPSQIDEVLKGESTIDAFLSDEALAAAAWAYGNDPARYAKLKSSLPKGITARDYERAVKQRVRTVNPEEGEASGRRRRPTQLLVLNGISTPGMLIPEDWVVTDKGIRYVEGNGVVTPVSPEPIFVSAILENVDDGTEKIEITFRHHGRYKSIIAPHSDMVNKNAIVAYANYGLPVSSGTSGYLTRYISEFEGLNKRVIPTKRCVARAGWIGEEEFFPYCLKTEVIGQESEDNSERILEALHTEGDEKAWNAVAEKVRTLPFARAMLAASFASPLLVPLQHRNIFYHSWHNSRSGKTAALKFAASIWGDPQKIMMSYFSTIVGMEHRAGIMCHLPLCMDELQSLDRHVNVNNLVYSLGNGEGKTRGRAGGGIRSTDKWRNCIISTGEQSISEDNSMDGINTRLLEVYGCPVPDEDLAIKMHQVSERNFGFAGQKYINWIMEKTSKECLRKDFEDMDASLAILYVGTEITSTQISNIAVLALADYYSSLAVFGLDQDEAMKEAIDLGQTLLGKESEEDHTDTVDRAWDFVCSWVAENADGFESSTRVPTTWYGIIDKNRNIFVIANVLNRALKEEGFSYRKVTRGFGERGYVNVNQDAKGNKRTQIVKRVNGIPTRVYALNLTLGNNEEEGYFPKVFENC